MNGRMWREEREGGMTQLYENLKNKRNYKIHGVFWKGYCQYSVNTWRIFKLKSTCPNPLGK